MGNRISKHRRAWRVRQGTIPEWGNMETAVTTSPSSVLTGLRKRWKWNLQSGMSIVGMSGMSNEGVSGIGVDHLYSSKRIAD